MDFAIHAFRMYKNEMVEMVEGVILPILFVVLRKGCEDIEGNKWADKILWIIERGSSAHQRRSLI
jgi:hypothetical protein